MRKEIKKIPGIGPFLIKIKRLLTPCSQILSFNNSSQYWDDRYRLGGNSGAGSYGRLALFKAEFLNEFVITNKVNSVVEYGCGDGAQLTLANYSSYTGFDVSPHAIEICRNKFLEKNNYEFFVTTERSNKEGTFDLAISLDVIYHLVENDEYELYMHRLFSASSRYVIIYAYNFNKTYVAKHEMGREFVSWCSENYPNWTLSNFKKNKYPYNSADPINTSQSDFYIFTKVSG